MHEARKPRRNARLRELNISLSKHRVRRNLKDKKPRPSIYPFVISTVALLISASSFYFTYFRVNHSLELAVVKSGPSDNETPCSFSVDTILLNKGNRTETFLSAELIFVGEDTVFFPASSKGPFVLKSGDALPLRIEVKFNDNGVFENGPKWSGEKGNRKAEVEMVLQVSAIDSKGRELQKRITLGKLVYEEDPNNYFTFSDSPSKELSLVELTR
jgi:hypothetical protein